LREHIAEVAQVVGHGGFLEILAFQIREIPAVFVLHVSDIPTHRRPFLFGVLVWRFRDFAARSDHRHLLFGLAIGGVVLGAALAGAVEGRALFGWPFV